MRKSSAGVIQVVGCDEAHHAHAIQQFTTGEVIVMSKWWCDMPKLKSHAGMLGIQSYIDACHHDEGSYMLSWRAAGAPIFTVAYRGRVSRPANPLMILLSSVQLPIEQ